MRGRNTFRPNPDSPAHLSPGYRFARDPIRPDTDSPATRFARIPIRPRPDSPGYRFARDPIRPDTDSPVPISPGSIRPDTLFARPDSPATRFARIPIRPRMIPSSFATRPLGVRLACPSPTDPPPSDSPAAGFACLRIRLQPASPAKIRPPPDSPAAGFARLPHRGC
jgi:hypothetical protein